MYKGPAKSIPVTAKVFWFFTRSAGRGASIWRPRGFLAILHGRHLCSTFLMAWRARNIQNSSLSSDRMIRTPRWWSLMCVCQINKWTKWCSPSSRSGWRVSAERSANCKRPPRWISPSSRNGLNWEIYKSLGRSTLLWRALRSTAKHSVCTALIQY